MDFIKKIKVPKGMDSYIMQHIAPSYIIFNKKTEQAYCTSCGANYTFPEGALYRHNQEVYCTKCSSLTKIKYSHYGRKKLKFDGKIFWLQKDKEDTLAGLARFTVDYTQSKAEVSYIPDAAYLLSAKEQKYYRRYVQMNNNKWEPVWAPRKKIVIPKKMCMFGHGEEVFFYKPSIKSMGTDFKYIDTSLLGKEINPFYLLDYMLLFIRQKSTDLLVKAGFKNLVIDKIATGAAVYNIRGKKLETILRLSKKEIKELPRNINAYTLKEIYKAKKIFPNAGYEIEVLMYPRMLEERMEILKQYNTDVLYKYLIKNEIRIKDYIDYLHDLKELGIPENKKTLRPKDFYEQHAIIANRVADAKLEHKTEDFRKHEEAIAIGNYEEDKYIITLPSNPKELVLEGQEQHHCVGTYIDRVCNGICAITFLREKRNPNKPFYTIEVSKDGKITQCRGNYNRGYDQEIKEVLERYTKWLKEEHNERIKNAG